ncbi:MAG: hypothetical protein NVS3B24_06530 [Candidatus Dormibacteria bacterium]
MIAPEVRIEAVDPLGFAWLCELASRRQQRDQPFLWVRHRGGQLTGSLPESVAADPRLQSIDLTAEDAAANVLRWFDAQRVVLIDENLVDDLGAELDGVADAALDQLAFFGRCQELFWASPAVRTAPGRPAASRGWSRVRRALGSQDMAMAIVVMDGDRVHLALRAEVREGLVRRLTSPSIEPGIGTEVERAITSIDAPRPADVLVVATKRTVEEAFDADDLPAFLLDRLREESAHQRGLEVFAA